MAENGPCPTLQTRGFVRTENGSGPPPPLSRLVSRVCVWGGGQSPILSPAEVAAGRLSAPQKPPANTALVGLKIGGTVLWTGQSCVQTLGSLRKLLRQVSRQWDVGEIHSFNSLQIVLIHKGSWNETLADKKAHLCSKSFCQLFQ